MVKVDVNWDDLPMIVPRSVCGIMMIVAGTLFAWGCASVPRILPTPPAVEEAAPQIGEVELANLEAELGSVKENAATRFLKSAKTHFQSPKPNDKRLNGQLSLAQLSERRGQTEQARHLYLQYLDKQPHDPFPHHRLGIMAAKASQYEEAEQYLHHAISLGPPSTDLLNDLGYLYFLQDRFEEAEELLNQALAQDPNHAAANNNLGLLLGEQRRYSEGLAAFKRAVSEAEAHTNMAYVLAQVGEHREALVHYSAALTLDKELRPAAQAMVQLAERRPDLTRRRQSMSLDTEPDTAVSGEDLSVMSTRRSETLRTETAAGHALADYIEVDGDQRATVAVAAWQADDGPAEAGTPASASQHFHARPERLTTTRRVETAVGNEFQDPPQNPARRSQTSSDNLLERLLRVPDEQYE